MKRTLTGLGFGCIAATALLGGCSSDATSDHTGTAQSNIFNGTPTTTHLEVAAVTTSIGAGISERSAEVLAPTLAVVPLAAVTNVSASSGQTSKAQVCFPVGTLVEPSAITLTIYAADGSTSTRGVTQIIGNSQINTCDGDMVFLVLDQPVTGVTFPQLVLDGTPTANDATTACAEGSVDIACPYPPSPTCGTGNVLLPAGGFFAPAQFTYPAGYAVTSNNACQGDEGGPVYDSSGAVIGIIDNWFDTDPNVVAGDPQHQNQCAHCDTTAVSITGLFAPHKDYVARAFATVGLSPWRKGHPKPADIGGTCTDALDCNSQFCVRVGSAGYCSTECETTACPSSTVCTTVGARSVCLPDVKPHPASCNESGEATHPDSPSTFALVGLALAGVIGVGRRRRRNNKHGGRES